MWAIDKHRYIWKKIILLLCESLDKDICHLKIARYMRKRDSLSFNLDMFIAFMEDKISWNMNDTSIIHMQKSRTTWREAKFNQYPRSQYVLLHDLIFRFSKRLRNTILFLDFSRNKSRTMKHTPTRCRTSSVTIIIIINIIIFYKI